MCGKKDKQLERLKGLPRDFTFDEARTLLESCGYAMSNSGKTSGSRVKFYIGKKMFAMHKPHPRKELLEYQIKSLIRELKEEGFYD
jgi:hypothetical protein